MSLHKVLKVVFAICLIGLFVLLSVVSLVSALIAKACISGWSP
jgi:hypothetical protein